MSSTRTTTASNRAPIPVAASAVESYSDAGNNAIVVSVLSVSSNAENSGLDISPAMRPVTPNTAPAVAPPPQPGTKFKISRTQSEQFQPVFEQHYERYLSEGQAYCYDQYESLLRLFRDSMIDVYNLTSDHFIRKANITIEMKREFFIKKFQALKAKLRQLRESNRRNNPVVNDVDTFLFLDADSAVDNPYWQPSTRLVRFTIDIGLYMCYNKKPKSGSEHIAGSSYYLWQLCQDMATIFLYEERDPPAERENESASTIRNVQDENGGQNTTLPIDAMAEKEMSDGEEDASSGDWVKLSRQVVGKFITLCIYSVWAEYCGYGSSGKGGYSHTWLVDEGIRRGTDRFNEYNLGVWKSLNYPCCPIDGWNLTAIEKTASETWLNDIVKDARDARDKLELQDMKHWPSEVMLSQAARKKWRTNFSRAIQAAQINIP